MYFFLPQSHTYTVHLLYGYFSNNVIFDFIVFVLALERWLRGYKAYSTSLTWQILASEPMLKVEGKN